MSYTELKAEPTPDHLADFVPFACGRLCAPFRVHVLSKLQEDSINKPMKESLSVSKKTSTLGRSFSRLQVAGSPRTKEASISASVPTGQDDPSDLYILYAKTDAANHVSELSIAPHKKIPRLLIKILSLCIPFNIYLNKLTMQCHLDGATMYETVKMLSTSQITEMYLDDSRLPERNYYIVLEQTRLQVLSLARCSLSDEDCALLIPKLAYPNHASKTLNTLILSSNFISNIGATMIAKALRSNRTLMYLNLSGNRICDAGAMEIFRSLMEFPLSSEELLDKRRRTLYNLKLRSEVYQKCYEQLMAAPLDISEDRSTKQRNTNPGIIRKKQSFGEISMVTTAEVLAARAEKMTSELVGADSEPFHVDATVNKDNILYSKGNLTLNYLNLAYNYVGYESVVKLVEVLSYQACVAKFPDLGLVALQLDGNETPQCSELLLLSDLLTRALQVRLMYAAPQTARRPKKKSQISARPSTNKLGSSDNQRSTLSAT